MTKSTAWFADLLKPGLCGKANSLGRDATIYVDPVTDGLRVVGDDLDFTISCKEIEDDTYKKRFVDELDAWQKRVTGQSDGSPSK